MTNKPDQERLPGKGPFDQRQAAVVDRGGSKGQESAAPKTRGRHPGRPNWLRREEYSNS